MGIRDLHFSIFRHPHHYAASIVAKMATNFATLIWSAVVLWQPNSLQPDRFFSFYSLLVSIAHEDVWASGALVFSTFGVYRLVSQRPPHWWGGIGYLAMMIFWTYLALTYVIFSTTPLRPATAAWFIVGAILSIYAFVSNPRTRNNDAPNAIAER